MRACWIPLLHAVGSDLLWVVSTIHVSELTAKTAITLELAQKDRLALVFVSPLGNQEKRKYILIEGLKI